MYFKSNNIRRVLIEHMSLSGLVFSGLLDELDRRLASLRFIPLELHDAFEMAISFEEHAAFDLFLKNRRLPYDATATSIRCSADITFFHRMVSFDPTSYLTPSVLEIAATYTGREHAFYCLMAWHPQAIRNMMNPLVFKRALLNGRLDTVRHFLACFPGLDVSGPHIQTLMDLPSNLDTVLVESGHVAMYQFCLEMRWVESPPPFPHVWRALGNTYPSELHRDMPMIVAWARKNNAWADQCFHQSNARLRKDFISTFLRTGVLFKREYGTPAVYAGHVMDIACSVTYIEEYEFLDQLVKAYNSFISEKECIFFVDAAIFDRALRTWVDEPVIRRILEKGKSNVSEYIYWRLARRLLQNPPFNGVAPLIRTIHEVMGGLDHEYLVLSMAKRAKSNKEKRAVGLWTRKLQKIFSPRSTSSPVTSTEEPTPPTSHPSNEEQ